MKLKSLSLLACAAVLTACGTGTKLHADGSPAGELYWPHLDKVQFDHHLGTFPNLENLANVRPGATRDELYHLLGRPHFSEGFHVREWNYVFYFNTPGRGANGVSTCEFKVLFDKDKYAQHFYWKAIDPADGVCPPFVKKKEDVNLAADALFAFDRSSAGDITGDGRRKLDALAARLQQFSQISSIKITGYTDRLGSDAYNRALSQARAETVAAYLAAQGVQADSMTAVGLGESHPVVQCHNSSHKALIACLAPNRRVTIEIEGFGA